MYLSILSSSATVVSVAVFKVKQRPYPWLSRAWLLMNLHWAAKFKVKKCWAQSHRVILCWAKQIQEVWSPGHQHNKESIHKRICSNKFKTSLPLQSVQGNELMQGMGQSWSITDRHLAEPTTATMTPPSKKVRFLLHYLCWLCPKSLLKGWLLAEGIWCLL